MVAHPEMSWQRVGLLTSKSSTLQPDKNATLCVKELESVTKWDVRITEYSIERWCFGYNYHHSGNRKTEQEQQVHTIR